MTAAKVVFSEATVRDIVEPYTNSYKFPDCFEIITERLNMALATQPASDLRKARLDIEGLWFVHHDRDNASNGWLCEMREGIAHAIDYGRLDAMTRCAATRSKSNKKGDVAGVKHEPATQPERHSVRKGDTNRKE